MTKKLLRCGNDTLAVVIDQSILSTLSITEETPLIVEIEGDKIIIRKKIKE